MLLIDLFNWSVNGQSSMNYTKLAYRDRIESVDTCMLYMDKALTSTDFAQAHQTTRNLDRVLNRFKATRFVFLNKLGRLSPFPIHAHAFDVITQM